MSKYSLHINISPKYDSDAKAFIKFIQCASKRFPIKINYRTIKKGVFSLTFESKDTLKSDAFFQELILNRGLYYYACTLKSKKEIVRYVVMPIFKRIIEYRFERTHEKLLKRHILGKISTTFIPGDIFDDSGHKYENLFFRWDVGILSNYDFVKDLDDLLTGFMLKSIGARKGEKSPYFNNLVGMCSKQNLFFNDKDTKKAFVDIHELRTKGLHRQEKELSNDKVHMLASILYDYFRYYDEYVYSQSEKTIKSDGKYYRRIKYGDQHWLDENDQPYLDENGKPYDEYELAGKGPCGDCGVLRGEFHVSGCDIEQCPVCRGQKLGCGCDLDFEDDELKLLITSKSTRTP